MKPKTSILKKLRKNWWWKRSEIRRKVVSGVNWEIVEEAARNYELMRRSSTGKLFTQTFAELDRDGKGFVAKLWANWEQTPYRMVNDRNQFSEKGWTPVYEHQHRQWNLRMADKTLTDEFIREIRTLRRIQKVRAKHVLKGKKFRGVSWKLVEMLDRKLNGIGKLTDSERHTASDAQRRAKKYCREYRSALAKWNKGSLNPGFDPENSANTEHWDEFLVSGTIDA